MPCLFLPPLGCSPLQQDHPSMQGHPWHASGALLTPATPARQQHRTATCPHLAGEGAWRGSRQGEMKQDELQPTLPASLFPNPKLFLPCIWRSCLSIRWYPGFKYTFTVNPRNKLSPLPKQPSRNHRWQRIHLKVYTYLWSPAQEE